MTDSKKTKIGRPLMKVKWSVVEALVLSGHRLKDIAQILGMNGQTLRTACKREFGIDFKDYVKRIMEVNWDVVDGMLFVKASNKEIATYLGVSVKTLDQACRRDKGLRFASYSLKKRVVEKRDVSELSYQDKLILFLSRARAILGWPR